MGEPNGNMDEGLEFELVNEVFDPASHSKRNLAAFEVKKTGASESNVEAAEIFLKWLQRNYGDKIDPFRCFLEFGANAKKGMVALYVTDTEAEGATAIRWDEARKTFGFHLGAVLRRYPQLRPSTTVDALFQETKDKDGRPCLAIKLKGAPAKRKRPVDPEEKAQKEAEKAARQAARKLSRKKGATPPTAAPATGVAAAEQNEKGA